MFREELISIIIPVYNVEKYLHQCIDSVINQKYKNLQIILVDDGSTDNSGAICDMYKKKDGRIEVIHQTNRGLSAARNKGLSVARGEYVGFVDSDDLIADSFILTLYELQVQYNAQIACCDYVRGKKALDFLVQEEGGRIEILASEEMLSEWHGIRKRVETVVWNKLYRKELFSGPEGMIIFPEGKNHEDICTTHKLVEHSSRVVITDCKLYFYRKRKDSIINRGITAKEIDDIVYAQRIRLDFFRNISQQSYERLLVGAQKHRMLYYIRAKGKNGMEKSCHELMELYCQDQNVVVYSKYCQISEKLMFRIFDLFFAKHRI